jgi:hypothetical protein
MVRKTITLLDGNNNTKYQYGVRSTEYYFKSTLQRNNSMTENDIGIGLRTTPNVSQKPDKSIPRTGRVLTLVGRAIALHKDRYVLFKKVL